jgi:MinD superfamily P-loop ATPase
MDIGAENSGKLVARVKQEARSQAGAEQKDFILVDGAPGIGCPVTSSIAGADYVILVTEPTVSGIFDLKRIYEVIQEFRIKTGAVINKCDLNVKNTEELKTFFRQNGIEHLADIPFDLKIPKAMSEGRTIVETEPSYQTLFNKILEKITEEKP